MLLSIHTDGPVPIYEQIVAQLIFAVASGQIEPGSLVPSVRDLAQQVRVNPNTVARAFQELERAGVLATKRGVGMEVTPDAAELCRARRKAIVRERLREALREAVSSALPADELRAMVDEELTRVNGTARKRGKP
jgi:GntR family transcriptional regulator